MTWVRSQPASLESVARLEAMAGFKLPPAYLNHLRQVGGGEGELDVDPGWIQFWSAEEVVELNGAYEVRQNIPGFFGFASNGGGELLAFDLREEGDPPVVMVPFIPMSVTEARHVANTFEELRGRLGDLNKSSGVGYMVFQRSTILARSARGMVAAERHDVMRTRRGSSW